MKLSIADRLNRAANVPYTARLAAAIASISVALASDEALVAYDPTGPQNSGTPVAPSLVAPGVSASDLLQVGLPGWFNSGTWPVGGPISSSTELVSDQYVTLTVELTEPTCFSRLDYSKRSYLGFGPRQAALRTSLDGFAANVSEVSDLNPGGPDDISFDLRSLPVTSGEVELRIYFWGAPIGGLDWADLDSSDRGRSGLVLRVNPDSDGDGITDCDDSCPDSDLTSTVVINGCDSGVANVVLANGCTLADEIAHCAAGARNHGAFVSCVAHLTSGLKAAGIITRAQGGAIQSCAARSNIGK